MYMAIPAWIISLGVVYMIMHIFNFYISIIFILQLPTLWDIIEGAMLGETLVNAPIYILHWNYVNEDLAASVKKVQCVVGTPITYWERSWTFIGVTWSQHCQVMLRPRHVHAKFLLCWWSYHWLLCACGTWCLQHRKGALRSYLYNASLGRHAKVKVQAAVEECAQGQGEESCRQIDPMPESVTSENGQAVNIDGVVTESIWPLHLCYAIWRS
jgi:hypothetical protein